MIRRLIYIIILLAVSVAPVYAESDNYREMRLLVNEGNKSYKDSNYDAALQSYYKAASLVPYNDKILYNIALTLSKIEQAQAQAVAQAGIPYQAPTLDDSDEPHDPKSFELFEQLVRTSPTDDIRVNSAINAGNHYFYADDLNKSIEYYKTALRTDPDNEIARQNLRQAQLKLKDEEQNGGNDNQDQQQQQGQDKQQNQQDQQQQNQDQQQNQNQQQNQDQQQNQNQHQNQNQQDKDQQQDKDERESNQSPQQSNEQILNAIDKREAAVRQRVNGEEEARKINAVGLYKPW